MVLTLSSNLLMLIKCHHEQNGLVLLDEGIHILPHQLSLFKESVSPTTQKGKPYPPQLLGWGRADPDLNWIITSNHTGIWN